MGNVFEKGSSYIIILEDSASLERIHLFTNMVQLLLVVFIFCVIGIISTIVLIFVEPPSCSKVQDLKIGKKEFVMLALRWCSTNLGTIKHPYELKIHYYRHKKYGGRFLFKGKQIVIYIYPDLDVNYLIDTVIHEYRHHLQFDKKVLEQDYDKKLKEVGYWNNPFEIDARKVALQHRETCLKWVLKQI